VVAVPGIASILTWSYSVLVSLPRQRLQGCACKSPLAHFYIYHSKSSVRELHPFTTITHLASENHLTPQNEDDLSIQFIFRKRGQPAQSLDPLPRKDGFAAAMLRLFSPGTRQKSQWTAQLADLADPDSIPSETQRFPPKQPLGESSLRDTSKPVFGPNHPRPIIDISLRLEGPYFTPADPSSYRTVICLVAGSGISGAIAIAGAFAEHNRLSGPGNSGQEGPEDKRMVASSSEPRAKRTWERCVIVWSVREDDYVAMPFLKPESTDNLEVRIQLTGKGRPRMDVNETLTEICAEKPTSTWVYISGPDAFISAAEKACREIAGLDYFGARW